MLILLRLVLTLIVTLLAALVSVYAVGTIWSTFFA